MKGEFLYKGKTKLHIKITQHDDAYFNVLIQRKHRKTKNQFSKKKLQKLQPVELQKKKYISSLYYFDKRSTFEANFVKLNQHFNVNLKYT